MIVDCRIPSVAPSLSIDSTTTSPYPVQSGQAENQHAIRLPSRTDAAVVLRISAGDQEERMRD